MDTTCHEREPETTLAVPENRGGANRCWLLVGSEKLREVGEALSADSADDSIDPMPVASLDLRDRAATRHLRRVSINASFFRTRSRSVTQKLLADTAGV